MKKTIEPDMRKYPFRGILTEIAEEEKVTRSAVAQRRKRGDPKTLQKIALKVQEKLAMVRQLEEQSGSR
jgi:predicted DNA-binding protein YlxM (UPF0122 family)